MSSTNLCSCQQSNLQVIDKPTKNLHVDIHRGLFSSKHIPTTDPRNWYNQLISNVKWHRVKYKSNRFQSECETPCYTAFYGGRTEYKPYTPIPDWFKPLIDEVTDHLNSHNKSGMQVKFNAFLLRLYFDGNDEIAWHTDGRTFLGDEPTIASLSLGSKATFQLRRMTNVWPCVDGSTSTEGCIDTQTPIESFVLDDGDLLVMKSKTQQYWHHRVPKEKKRGVRLNINFRYILPGVDAQRGQMTYYKYMVYGDVPTDRKPPSWTFDEIMKKKGGMMNFVKGGIKRKAVAVSANEQSTDESKNGIQLRSVESSNISQCTATKILKSSQTVESIRDNESDIQLYISSQQDIDYSVFSSLPIEIQNELVSEWKNQSGQTTKGSQRSISNEKAVEEKLKINNKKGPLDSFFGKK